MTRKPQSNAEIFSQRRADLAKKQLVRRLDGDNDQLAQVDSQIARLERQKAVLKSSADSTVSRLVKKSLRPPSMTTPRRPEKPRAYPGVPKLADVLRERHQPRSSRPVPSPPPASPPSE